MYHVKGDPHEDTNLAGLKKYEGQLRILHAKLQEKMNSEFVNFSIFAAISRREGIPAPVRQARVECRLALAKPANSPQATSL
ncbi:MAG: hypothetical protein ACREYE_31665, partial [Gammaproteobacteria bacterium]